MLNKERQRTELSVLYEREEFHQVSGALNLHQIITSSGLQNSPSEVYLLSAENHTHNTYDNNRAREMLFHNEKNKNIFTEHYV
jgi:hypothetical protein